MPLRRRHLLGVLAASSYSCTWAQSAAAATPPTEKRSALLVVDAQVGVLSPVWDAKRVVSNLQVLVAKARAARTPVIWVQHADNEIKYGSDAWKFVPELLPSAAEPVIHKTFNSSFASTDLDTRLKSMGVTRLVLAGAATNWCIRATAYAAVERGYHLTLVGDAHSTEPLQLPEGNVVPAEAIVSDMNAVFQWLSAPNVRTEVQSTKAVEF